MSANFIPVEALPVLPSCLEVASRSNLVYFHPEKIAPAIGRWGPMLDAATSWDHPCHFFDGTEETVRWIFTLDVLNHCFWPDPGENVWTVRYRDEDWSGYWGLAAALKRAREAGFPVTDPLWLSKITPGDLDRILSYQLPPDSLGPAGKRPEGAAGNIPLFSERLRNLREAGSIILSELGADVVSLVGEAAGRAVWLVSKVADLFPSFRDETAYEGNRVYFWKRAQIFASDIYAAFGGKELGEFHDIHSLTAFADYKLPQVLRELGVISYHPVLAKKIDSLEYLDPGSKLEVEIRAMTVVAVERIRNAFEVRRGKTPDETIDGCSRRGITSARVDSWLWRLGQMDEFRKRPYHRCRTIYY